MQKIDNFNKDIKNAIEKNEGETHFIRHSKYKNLKDYENIYFEKDLKI